MIGFLKKNAIAVKEIQTFLYLMWSAIDTTKFLIICHSHGLHDHLCRNEFDESKFWALLPLNPDSKFNTDFFRNNWIVAFVFKINLFLSAVKIDHRSIPLSEQPLMDAKPNPFSNFERLRFEKILIVEKVLK